MLLDADDAAIMLEAIGESATVDGGATSFQVLFKDSEQVVDYQTDQMVRTDPFCIVAIVDITAQGIHGDPNGTPITIGATVYRVMSVNPDGPVFAILSLGV